MKIKVAVPLRVAQLQSSSSPIKKPGLKPSSLTCSQFFPSRVRQASTPVINYLLTEIEFLQGNSHRAMEFWEGSQRSFKEVENNEFGLSQSTLPFRAALVRGNYQHAIELSETLLAAGKESSSKIVVSEALGHLAWALQD
jgi:hypothetical protein